MEQSETAQVVSEEIQPSGELEKNETSLLREMMYLLRKLLVLALFIAALVIFVFGVARNTDLGMSPSVKNGDLVLYFRLDKQYKATDVIAFEVDGTFQTRRVVAVAGDTVDFNEYGLIVNGSIQQDLEVIGETLPYVEGINFPVTVGENEVFVLGDSRETASDSRIYGSVNIDNTLGKVFMILRRRSI